MKAEPRRCVLTDTYNEIYERMKKKYEAESKSVFDEASDIAIRLKVLAGEIYNAQTNIEWLKNQMFVTTASGKYLDYIAAQRGLERRKATKAQGIITFYIPEALDRPIIIPKGTVVATSEEVPVRFCTVDEEQLYAGQLSMDVDAEAEKPGANGNIEFDKAVVAVSVPAEISSVTNRVLFTGGSDEESDNELRERIKQTFVSQPNGTNAAFYKQLALSVDGITKAGVLAKVRGTGTVNIYVCGNGVEAGSDSIAELQSLVNRERELNVDVRVYNAEFYNYNLDVTVTAKSGYGSAEVVNKCTEAFKSYINSLPVGGKLYLSALGKYLLDTDCIDNYEFNTNMENCTLPASQCFRAGSIDIAVV